MCLIIYLQAILSLLIAFAHNSLLATYDDQELWQAARRELARRTRDYIRRNPISEELRSFIEELTPNKRKKRDDTDKGRGKTEETVVDSLVEEKLKTTSETNKLDYILEDIQSLVSAEKKGHGSSKEGALCNVTGYWDSETGGMLFHIKKSDAGAAISMKPREPPSDDGFIVQDKWNVTGRIPFAQSAQVIIRLSAHKGRRIALFLGECRICDGSETITGDWLVGRTSTDCKNQKASHSYIADIFRKNNVEALREAHLNKLSSLTTSETSSTEMPDK